ncbi:MAG: histidine phosphatase family protein [Candidatus Micrarchaeota archaeon]|nr:histidine phosphatase family protein [Candidatus Micrarchaeota archaeon]MDE1824431.1 histidine phosphatase family protein [Candidatus Micrarchaeota archaeon]
MKVIAVRHGQSIGNVKGIIQGHTHGTLTAKGRAQARLAARRLKSFRFDVIYSSDLRRARMTAMEIVKFHRYTDTLYVKELRERSFGVLEGRMAREIAPNGTSKEFWHRLRPLNGESHAQLRRRLAAFIRLLKKRHRNETVLFVTHGVVMQALMAISKNRPASHMKRIRTPGNAALRFLEYK